MSYSSSNALQQQCSYSWLLEFALQFALGESSGCQQAQASLHPLCPHQPSQIFLLTMRSRDMYELQFWCNHAAPRQRLRFRPSRATSSMGAVGSICLYPFHRGWDAPQLWTVSAGSSTGRPLQGWTSFPPSFQHPPGTLKDWEWKTASDVKHPFVFNS